MGIAAYRCGIVGAGRRAHEHARAYSLIERGRLVAISSRDATRRTELGDRHGVSALYHDHREMFEKERLDLIHVCTPPDARLDLIRDAEKANIPGIILEKPVAIQGDDWKAIRAFSRSQPNIKVVVNHQLHFHPRRRLLQAFVESGGIGDVLVIDASARLNLAYQGTHLLQSIISFAGDTEPATVFGQVAGVSGLVADRWRHLAPDDCVACIALRNGITAVLRCGPSAPRVTGGQKTNEHKRIAVFGKKGYVQWTMWSWELSCPDRQEQGEHHYDAEDVLGQAALVEAMFDWLESDRAAHPLRLDRALAEFNVVLALYMSALHAEVVATPVEPEDELIDSLRTYVQHGRQSHSPGYARLTVEQE